MEIKVITGVFSVVIAVLFSEMRKISFIEDPTFKIQLEIWNQDFNTFEYSLFYFLPLFLFGVANICLAFFPQLTFIPLVQGILLLICFAILLILYQQKKQQFKSKVSKKTAAAYEKILRQLFAFLLFTGTLGSLYLYQSLR